MVPAGTSHNLDVTWPLRLVCDTARSAAISVYLWDGVALTFRPMKSHFFRRLIPLLALISSLAIPNAWARSEVSVAAEEMVVAASKFSAALNAEQKAKATFELKSDERLNWHFIPKARKGLPMKEMSPTQRELALALLKSGLSQKGYVAATTIMTLESILRELEKANPKMVRDPELYYVSLFGTPSLSQNWGWRVEGHHFSANFTVAKGGEIAATPNFMGTNPAEVRDGERKGLRVLADVEDLGRKLVKSLDAEQRAATIFTNTAPADIYTAAARKVTPLTAVGVAAAKLNAEQTAVLKQLIEEYVGRVRPDLAAKDLAKIQAAGFEKILFAWAGGIEAGQGHYYRVQGPTFLLEYDNTQNGNNHVHAVWRDFNGDFGEDLLKKHYEQEAHPKN